MIVMWKHLWSPRAGDLNGNVFCHPLLGSPESLSSEVDPSLAMASPKRQGMLGTSRVEGAGEWQEVRWERHERSED